MTLEFASAFPLSVTCSLQTSVTSLIYAATEQWWKPPNQNKVFDIAFLPEEERAQNSCTHVHSLIHTEPLSLMALLMKMFGFVIFNA